MNKHLTDEQITAWLAANPDALTREHLQHCAECTREAEQLQSLVARFGETMRREAAATEPRRELRPHFSFVSLRQALAGVAALLLLASALLLSPSAPLRQQNSPTAAVQQDPDDVLLMEVQSDVQRDVPLALEPAVLIVTERNRLAAMPIPQSEGENR
jgi:hypothetical protein